MNSKLATFVITILTVLFMVAMIIQGNSTVNVCSVDSVQLSELQEPFDDQQTIFNDHISVVMNSENCGEFEYRLEVYRNEQDEFNKMYALPHVLHLYHNDQLLTKQPVNWRYLANTTNYIIRVYVDHIEIEGSIYNSKIDIEVFDDHYELANSEFALYIKDETE